MNRRNILVSSFLLLTCWITTSALSAQPSVLEPPAIKLETERIETVNQDFDALREILDELEAALDAALSAKSTTDSQDVVVHEAPTTGNRIVRLFTPWAVNLVRRRTMLQGSWVLADDFREPIDILRDAIRRELRTQTYLPQDRVAGALGLPSGDRQVTNLVGTLSTLTGTIIRGANDTEHRQEALIELKQVIIPSVRSRLDGIAERITSKSAEHDSAAGSRSHDPTNGFDDIYTR